MNLFVDAAPCIYLFIFKGQGSSSWLLDIFRTSNKMSTRCKTLFNNFTLCGPGPDLRARLPPLTFLTTDSLLRPSLMQQIERFLCLLSTLACTNWSASFRKCSGPSHGQNVELLRRQVIKQRHVQWFHISELWVFQPATYGVIYIEKKTKNSLNSIKPTGLDLISPAQSALFENSFIHLL